MNEPDAKAREAIVWLVRAAAELTGDASDETRARALLWIECARSAIVGSDRSGNSRFMAATMMAEALAAHGKTKVE